MNKIIGISVVSIALLVGLFMIMRPAEEPVLVVEAEQVSLSEEEVDRIEAFATENNIGYFEAVAILKLEEVTEYTKEELLLLERDVLLDLALDATRETLNIEGLKEGLEARKAEYEAEKLEIEALMETYDLSLSNALLITALLENDDTLVESELALLSQDALLDLTRTVIEEETSELRESLAPYLEEARSNLEDLKERFESFKEQYESNEDDPTEETPSL